MVLVWLTGCGSTPTPSGTPGRMAADPVLRDGGPGPEAASLPLVADAIPRVEPIQPGGPNKPYVIAGNTYRPVAEDVEMVERGLASWYGRRFQGRRTASGEAFNMYAATAAHRTMPLPSYALVRNPANGRELIVRVNDRGPFSRDRVIDLSWAAARSLGVLNGVSPVEVRRLTFREIQERWPPDDSGSVPAGVTGAAPDVAPVVRARTSGAVGFWLQFGAFQKTDGALRLQQDLADAQPWLQHLLAVVSEGGLHKVQAGPFPDREQAQAAAARARAAPRPAPLLLERR
ncbi:septal ring lytic transglycosylase RlpA family protein [Ideonella livida]|uniref:Endolytic peptidoglycan transglycosylase RlpA n=1 Tax=Ideonella livida TaxID=2707176 RepID=A0A7C9PFX9_9BURK|nr:septal ring lytic transglycosylase RlpA family protein [Ideonella livida]NDY90937.1 septal ring lytic transglycosylase RlpA family protein [Ideonella livida]